VHDGMMVGVVADNAKLRGRAAGIVRRIAGADADEAERALAAAEGDVKAAILLAAGAPSPAAARAALATHDNHLRGALAALGSEVKS
ncbi:MAG: N-acetylmuramic acid 6-phosphate etherase, partial [Maritimibacter sp.]|nr:N-acetylmuramic acid 6-phosphate etherase [Maritimibacter sp.]